MFRQLFANTILGIFYLVSGADSDASCAAKYPTKQEIDESELLYFNEFNIRKAEIYRELALRHKDEPRDMLSSIKKDAVESCIDPYWTPIQNACFTATSWLDNFPAKYQQCVETVTADRKYNPDVTPLVTACEGLIKTDCEVASMNSLLTAFKKYVEIAPGRNDTQIVYFMQSGLKEINEQIKTDLHEAREKYKQACAIVTKEPCNITFGS